MNRQQKEKIVDSLKSCFVNNEASFLVGYKGLSVKQMRDLRTKLRDKDARLQVSKWRLMRLAVKDVPFVEELSPHFGGQIGLVFAKQDPVSVVKVLCDYSKDNKSLTVLYGCMYNKIMGGSDIQAVAKLPSMEILILNVIGVMNTPIFGVISVLNNTMRGLVIALKQIIDKGK